MSGLKWVCFDWGDTLADVRGTVEELQRDHELLKALESFGVKVTPAEFDEAYLVISREFSVSMRGDVTRWQKGLFLRKLCDRLNFPVTEEQAGRMSDYYNQHFISKLKLLEGAKLLDIGILDHLILTPHEYLSFADTGLLSGFDVAPSFLSEENRADNRPYQKPVIQ